MSIRLAIRNRVDILVIRCGNMDGKILLYYYFGLILLQIRIEMTKQYKKKHEIRNTQINQIPRHYLNLIKDSSHYR